jgi:hypothetical protein
VEAKVIHDISWGGEHDGIEADKGVKQQERKRQAHHHQEVPEE